MDGIELIRDWAARSQQLRFNRAGTTFADLSRCLNISSSAAAAATAFDAPRIIAVPSAALSNDHRVHGYALKTVAHSMRINGSREIYQNPEMEAVPIN